MSILEVTSVSLNVIAAIIAASLGGRHYLNLRRARRTIAAMTAERVSRETSPVYVVLADMPTTATWAAEHTDHVHPSNVFSIMQSPDMLRGRTQVVGFIDLHMAFRPNRIDDWHANAALLNRMALRDWFPTDLPFDVYWPGFDGGKLP